MRNRNTLAVIVSAALMAGLSAPAVAQTPPTAAGPKAEVKKAAEARKAAAEKRKEALEKTKEALQKSKAGAEDAKEARKDAKEAREDAKEAREDAKDARKEAREARHQAWKLTWDKLKETRKERRQQRRAEIKEKWGDLTKHPAVRSELKVHAWRMARLTRVRTLAKAAGKDAVVERADKLIEKEQARHAKHMETLKSKGGEE